MQADRLLKYFSVLIYLHIRTNLPFSNAWKC